MYCRFSPPTDDPEELQIIRNYGVASVQSALHMAVFASQSKAGHSAILDCHRLLLC